ncbi:MAG: hypothetical protein ACE5GZ_08440 [Gammaproteobacteria bacterium]
MNYRLSLMIVMTLFFSVLHAEDNDVEGAPSVDLLEFLGEWETADGKWVDPDDFGDDVYAGLPEQEQEESRDE